MEKLELNRSDDIAVRLRLLEKKVETMETELGELKIEVDVTYGKLVSDLHAGFKESDDLRSKTKDEITMKIEKLSGESKEVSHKTDLLGTEVSHLVKSTSKVIDKMDGRDKFIVNSAVGLVISVILIIIGIYVR